MIFNAWQVSENGLSQHGSNCVLAHPGSCTEDCSRDRDGQVNRATPHLSGRNARARQPDLRSILGDTGHVSQEHLAQQEGRHCQYGSVSELREDFQHHV